MTTVSAHAFTDVGLQRARNEDAVLVGGWLCQTHTGVLAAVQLPVVVPIVCAVADGMGGHAGGNLASNLALSTLSGLTEKWSSAADVVQSLIYVNDQIRSVGSDPDLNGLGTTVAGLCVTGEQIIAFNVGDSRVYRIDDGFLEQLSVDDSVHDAQGRTTNLVTQSLGQPDPVVPHIAELPLRNGSYLICSDGVSGVMPAADLRAAVRNSDLAVCARAIVDGARDCGASDNFSFVLLQVSNVPMADGVSAERMIDDPRPAIEN